MLASAGLDGSIRIWDANTGALLNTKSVGANRRITALAFSPNGQWLVSGSSLESADFLLWQVEPGGDLTQVPTSFPSIDVRRASFSPDSKLLAFVGTEGRRARGRIWNVETQMVERVFESASDASDANAYSIAFSPTNKMVATGDVDGKVRIWDVSTGKLDRALEGHRSRVVSVAYSPDGKLVASGSGDRRIGLWNAETGEHIRWLSGHISTVWSVAFSADSSTLASGGVDTLVRLWDIDTGEQTTTLRGHTRTVSAAAFSPVGTVVPTENSTSFQNNDLRRGCEILESSFWLGKTCR